MAAARRTHDTPVVADVPAFLLYALANAATNIVLVSIVISLSTRMRVVTVFVSNYRAVGVHFAVLWPLGLLMAVVYRAFGGALGLLLLVTPMIAAYAAIERARQLRDAHEQLTETHRRLKETQAQVVEQERLRALGQMASGIAHDFNNALAPVVGFSELLLLQPQQWRNEEFMRRYLGLIHTSAQDAAKVVRQLREFYRKPGEEDALLPVDLGALARQSVDITQPRWRNQAMEAGATIGVETELGVLPPVMGDEAALREVLTNLIFNAVDAMPNGGTIRLRTRTDAGRAVLEVTDGGTGMTEEVRQRCLDPFFTTKGSRGTGMGLSMVHGIMRRHGGEIQIDSAWGHGTTIRLLLPGCDSQTPIVSPSEETLSAEAASIGTVSARSLRVLVVDDEPAVRQVIGAYLESYGYAAEMATNGHEGLLRFRAGGFDAVMTDRAMPEMNGDHLARAVKAEAPRMPVIMLTGYGDLLNARQDRPPGVDAVLAKPVRRAELRETLDRLTAAVVPAS